jgi:uncharacterized protein YfaA (DUF2138 family)
MSEGVEFDSVVDGKNVKVKLLVENLDIERKCDTEYHIAYTQLMKRGILPKATLEKQMEELDIWTKDDEEKLTTLQRQLVDFQIELEAAKTHEEGLAIAKEMGVLRADCLKLVEAKAAVLSNSCESLADSIRRDAYIAYATVYADTSKRIFRDYHDFLLRATEPVANDARQELLAIATKTFQDALTSLPEVDYVRDVEAKIQEEAAKAETATTTKKKTTRKKRTTKKKVTKKTTARKAKN